MALSIVCPGCEADYSVPENLVGKSIRCKKCGETIAVKAAVKAARPKVRVPADDEEDDAPRRPTRRNRDDDDDDFDAPVKKKSKGLSPVLIGVLAVVVLAGGAGAAYLGGAFGSDTKPEVAVAPTKPRQHKQPKTDDTDSTDAPKTDTPKTDTPKAEDGSTTEKKQDAVPETKPIKTPAKEPAKQEPKIGMRAADGVANQPGGYELGLTRDQYRSGDMPPLVLNRVKAASVFIKTDVDQGSATGSGWFGIEPGIVFTNAHVLFMKAPKAPPPKRLTFFLNTGTQQRRVIPNANIKILAVDRDIDIACLQVINEKDLPAPLKVRPSSECSEGLGLNTIGYPFGYMPAEILAHSTKEPSVSVRRTTITAFRNNDFGILRRVQVEGAANPGNSGGPVVDAEGSVCCVIVEGVHHGGGTSGIALTGCVPTEYTFGLLAGRVAEVEYGMPYKADNGKVRIPVKLICLDPMNRLKKVGLMTWVGNSSEKYRAPGPNKPAPEPGDINYQETTFALDPKTHIAAGEVELPMLDNNTVYWGQAFHENVVYARYYEPGTVIDTHGPIAERVPAVLAYKPKMGTSRMVTMQNTSTLDEESDEEGESKNEKQLLRIGIRVRETTQAPAATDPVQAARLSLKFEELEMPQVVIGGAEHDIMAKAELTKFNTLFKLAAANALVNKKGQVYKTSLNTLNMNMPSLQYRYYFTRFSSDALDALKNASIEMPDAEKEGKGEVQPGTTWKWVKDQDITFQDRPLQMRQQGANGQGNVTVQLPPPRVYRFQEEYTAKYVGVRERAGTKEAVIEISGKAQRAPAGKHEAHGEIKGRVLVELDTGVILDADIDRDITVNTSERGIKKSASGIYHYKLTRSAAD